MLINLPSIVDRYKSEFQTVTKMTPTISDNSSESVPVTNLLDIINEASEEMADILSLFGRFGRGVKKNADDKDFMASVLEDNAEEKLGDLIRNVPKLQTINDVISFARNLFPDDSDLMLALRELLLSRHLSDSQKKLIKKALDDLEKYCDSKKLLSGVNVSKIAKNFSSPSGDVRISARELRSSYLRFLELSLPATYIYQEWIEVFGYHNRRRILAFMLSALLSDIKANESGILCAEFGPLCSRLTDARVLHTLDTTLTEQFTRTMTGDSVTSNEKKINTKRFIQTYLAGLIDYQAIEQNLKLFHDEYIKNNFVKQKISVIRLLHHGYNLTPEFLFCSPDCRDLVLDMYDSVLHSLHQLEGRDSHCDPALLNKLKI